MRLALALVLAALPATGLPVGAHAAEPAQDRYGPPTPPRGAAQAPAVVSYPTPDSVAREEASVAAQASGYHGRMLTWSSKGGVHRAPAEPARQAAAAPVPPESQRYETRQAPAPSPPPATPRPATLPQSLYGASAAPPPAQVLAPAQRPIVQAAAQPEPVLPRRTPIDAAGPAPARAATAPAPVRSAAAAPPAHAPAVALATAAPSKPVPAAPVPAKPAPQARAPIQTASAGKPAAPPQAVTSAQATPATPAAQTQVAMVAPPPAPPAAPVKARFYSLHRDYGDTPDPVALPAARPPVLIGPDQTATAPGATATPNGVAGDDANGAPDKPRKPQASTIF